MKISKTLAIDQKTVYAMEGTRLNQGKHPISLIPSSFIHKVAEVLGFGTVKYSKHNWRKGMSWSETLDSTERHLLAFNDGEDLDTESGLLHLAHAATNIAFLIEYYETNTGTDDRYKREG